MEGTKKILAVINPISGTDKKEYLPDSLSKLFANSDLSLEIRFTQHPNHAYSLARTAAENGYFGVIAVGGDGTVNEVASALCDTDTALGIIPFGSGNGLARHLRIPLNWKDAVRIILSKNVETLDYCTANEQPFFCTFGVGFDAQVSNTFAKIGSRGALGYIRSALKEYIQYRPQNYKIVTQNGIISEKAFIIACGNASQYGNNAYITPNADIKDGLIDTTVVLPITPFDTAILGILLFSGHIDQDTNIISFRTPSLRIEREKPGIVHLDGESVVMPAKIDVMCHHNGLKAFTPAKEEQKRKILSALENSFWDTLKSIRKELEI